MHKTIHFLTAGHKIMVYIDIYIFFRLYLEMTLRTVACYVLMKRKKLQQMLKLS